MPKSNLKEIKRENWKGRYVWTARDNKGILRSWGNVKNSKLTKQKAIEVYKEYKTFKTVKINGEKIRVKKESTKLTKLSENILVFKTTKESRNTNKTPLRKPTGKVVQYIVQGDINNTTVYGRSQAIGEKFAGNSRSAKEEAWNNFIARLNVTVTGGASDEDEGLKYINDVTNLKEGWVTYRGV